MAETTAGILLDILHDWGVRVIFGLPGDGINGLMEALRLRRDKIRFVQVRHEESAAFMACAYAKYTGKLGVCLGTSGPGGIHLLNGLQDAKMDGAPVVALTGQQYHDLIGTQTQQDVDLQRLFAGATVYSEMVLGPEHIENLAHEACRRALSESSVTHLCLPVDVQDMKAERRSKRNIADHETTIFAHHAGLPAERELRAAADILNAGKKVAMLVGRGALHAGAEVERTAELLGAPVVKALLGKAVIPDDSPYCAGYIGLLGTKPGQEAIESCDTLFMVGTSFPYLEFYPKPGSVAAVQLDIDARRIGIRHPVDVGLLGDSRATLRALGELLKPKANRGFLEKIQREMRDWAEAMDERASSRAVPMKPQVVAAELSRRLRDDAIVSCDSGTVATWWARHVRVRAGQKHSLSGNLATMACALPYTIAAQIAYPERQCVAFAGDGAVAMLMAEFATAVKYRLPIKVVVIKNNTLGQIKWEQMVMLGNPEYGCELHPIDFAMVARACGGAGFTIDDPARCGEILDAALALPGPAMIECVVDPFEPPLPPKVTAAQAARFAESLARGEPNALKIALTATSAKVREII